ncbi:transferase [Phascolomyces articulosus]|uniref:Transferase n=1 Tax=Phascolomyces articulosus TaxID=60185 RepID=A0AAD5K464_9FUNG|nr:transferase [Phascolomyces articulosus]
MDALIPPVGFSIIWSFSPPPDTMTINNILDNLKKSLAHALELYAPLIGTVHSDGNDNYYINLDDSSNPGIPFYFESKNAPYVSHIVEGLSARGDEKESGPLTSEASVLAIKVTQFSCRTIVIAATIHHQVSDLRSLLDFIEVWALLARDERIDYNRIPNDWSRTPSRFFPSHNGKPSTPSGWVIHSEPVPIEKILEPVFVPVKPSVWKITKSSINQLKVDLLSFKSNDNNGNSSTPSWISKADALTALAAGAITRARENSSDVKRLWGRSSAESKVENINITCNYRSRAPQGTIQSDDYFGNCLAMTNAAILRDDLLSATVDATSRVAFTIRSTLNEELRPQNIANYLAFFEPDKLVKPHARLHLKWDLIFSNWCQFDLKDPAIDFGWGKPLKGSPAGGDSAPGYCHVMNGDESGDIVMSLIVELACVKELEADPLLNKYAIRLV